MPRYELGKEFWDITHDDKRLVIVSGMIGRAGTETVRKFVSADKAQAQFVKLVGEKQAAGWTFVPLRGGFALSRSSAAPDDNANANDEAHDQKLEAAILANPYDESAYSVYGDWLQAQGSPRGQLIALQLAEENAPDNPKYRAATKKFLVEHRRAFTGGLDEHFALRGEDGPALVWRFGFVHRIVFDADTGMDCDLAKLFRDVMNHPSGRFVTEIGIRDRDVVLFAKAVEAIGENAPNTLRELVFKLGGQIEGFDAVRHLPLTKLVVKARFGGLEPACLRSIARAPATLEALEVRFGEEDDCAELMPLFGRTDLVALHRLVLRGCNHINEVCAALAAAPFAKQLRWLDLSLIEIDANCVRLLADRTLFPAVKMLRLSRNQIAPKSLTALTEAGFKVENVVADEDDIYEGEDGEYFDEIQE